MAALLLFCAGVTLAAEVIPSLPAKYFNDYAGVASTATANNLNRTLEDFERATSSQILVVIYPTMPSDSSIEDYTVRVAQSWRVGQKGKDNGAVLFIFSQAHKMFLQVGYGLEGALPDALCKRIIADEIAPRFKAGDFDGGLTAGVNAILAATKGEYKGTGQTVAAASRQDAGDHSSIVPFVIMVVVFILIFSVSRRCGTLYRGNGTSSVLGGWISSGGSSGGNWGGGGSSGGDSGFSGGGGSFGGGGAGGSW
ncbi:MAG TPA: TPM domain-containing protein [Verrucomicrobiae bacterium]